MQINDYNLHNVNIDLDHHDMLDLHIFYSMIVDYVSKHNFEKEPILMGLEKVEIEEKISIFEDLFNIDTFNMPKYKI